MRHDHLCGLLVGALAIFLLPGETVAQSPNDPELASRVDELVHEALAQPGAVGFSVAVARGEQVLLAKGYGLAEVEHGVPAGPETLFRIGSITKQFTAAAILRLVEQGKLSLDDDLCKFLPDYPTQGHVVTIRHLLNHTSGISIYTVPDFMINRTSRELTHEQVLAEFKDDPFDFAPGEKWSYNNSGYYLLGMVIEKVSGQAYGQFVQQEFFTPLSLARTRYDSTPEVIKNRAQGYSLEGETLVNDAAFAMSIPGGAGGLVSTAGDLVRWQIALAGGQVVSTASFQQMSTPTTLSDGKPVDYGFGLQLKEYRDQKYIGHGGGIAGFNSMLKFFPDQQVHVAVISNSESASSSSLAEAIAAVALNLPDENIQDMELTAAEMERYAGTYKLADLPMEAKVSSRDGKLYLQATDQPEFRLLAQGDHEFRAEFETGVKIEFDSSSEPAPSFVLNQNGSKITATRVIEDE